MALHIGEPENLSLEMGKLGKSDYQKEGKEELSPKEKLGDEAEEVSEVLPEVKKRVKALKKIQVEITKMEASFYEEMHNLECKYLSKYGPYFEQRKKIVSGDYEPSAEECEFVEGSDSEGETEKKTGKENSEDPNATKIEPVVGIPDFWLTILRNVDLLHELLEDGDEEILEHLTDVTTEMQDKPMGFKLLFHFSPNEYFTNSILTKTYEMNCNVDEEDPFSFEGPEIIRCKGCEIDWVEGKNVCLKTITKRQKHKQNNSTRVVSKIVNSPSFFNFFKPPEINPNLPLDEEIQMQLTTDYEIGQYIRVRIIPRAVLYYTGEALEEDFEMEDEEDSEDEEEEGEENDDEEEADISI